jgi:hypothetical protein
MCYQNPTTSFAIDRKGRISACQHSVRAWFLAIGIHGLSILVFALSGSMVLSLVALEALGAPDMHSWGFAETRFPK